MHTHLRAAVLAAVLCSSASSLSAQGVAHSFSELRLLVREGQTVTVVDTAGREVKGRITLLSADTLALGTGAGRSWQATDVATIRQRRQDSLGNGALIGLGVGVGLVGVAVLAGGGTDGEPEWAWLAAAFYGGVGAGIGVGIDALITREYDVFRPADRGPQVRLQPLWHPQGGGLRVAIAF
ncbi:hypothetical protein [Luteitalea sp.]|uniref:hypothetical protein n=1 Tax=Luteitalea sp. TaxID=2004800 RepID=UPI0025BF2F0D|nr:hypothetical protein [Luteitalea sp.]